MTVMQAYFIYNTFMLKQKQAQASVRSELILMEEKINITALRSEWINHMDYYAKTKQHEKMNYAALLKASEISKKVKDYINHNPVLSEYNTAYNVTIKDAKLAASGSNSPFVLKNKIWFGNGKALENPQIIHDMTSHIDGETNTMVKEFTTQSSFSINDWQRKILGQMLGLLLFSLFVFCLLIFLFYFSIRSLISQKKIADIQTDFINNITHEFNTPLATLGVAISTIEEQTKPIQNTAVNHAIRIAHRQHRRLKKLIDQVVVHASGQEDITYKKEKTEMNMFLSQIITDFNTVYPTIMLDFVSKHEEVDLYVYQFHLTTAINNILDNAVKYGAQHIKIQTHTEDNYYTLMIEDNGIGIAESEQHKIFEKFYRVERGDIHNTKGLGLGLYYAQQIIFAHEGKITVASLLPKGTIFTIYLPLS
ncbi:His Kinase A (phospho-acceptor) domain-containing protein [Chryseobacterium polytrichastri]|uniref:histidine kinase n=2 Tax=Chryseobacterium polytrichastri TaxID=1302687 RepID=A0A1M6Y6V5_9FLAO|nr:His Kinase A (phospho-acceptor) domain-containing protein [Chryseobacterium polytrichastri]